VISGVLIIPMILFLNLSQVTKIAALVVLIIQGLTHVGHLLRIKEPGANIYLVLGAVIGMFSIAGLTLYYTSRREMPLIGLYIFGAFILALAVEVILRMITKRTIMKQTEERLLSRLEQHLKDDFKKITGV
jgi:hypothetical protein